MINSRIIYQAVNSDDHQLRRDPYKFCRDLVIGLLVGYNRSVKRVDRPLVAADPLRLVNRYQHTLTPIPGWNCMYQPNHGIVLFVE